MKQIIGYLILFIAFIYLLYGSYEIAGYLGPIVVVSGFLLMALVIYLTQPTD
jgi:hypothetical protein